jgi:hypothetical protein
VSSQTPFSFIIKACLIFSESLKITFQESTLKTQLLALIKLLTSFDNQLLFSFFSIIFLLESTFFTVFKSLIRLIISFFVLSVTLILSCSNFFLIFAITSFDKSHLYLASDIISSTLVLLSFLSVILSK